MASSNKPPTPPRYEAPPSPVNYFLVDASLRVLLFSASLVSVIVMVTSKQTEVVPVPGLPFTVSRPAKFNHSPAFIYFVASLSVAGLYSIVTTLTSLSAISKPASAYSKTLLLLLAIGDVLILGVVASATGASGAVAYIGLKGNDHAGWNKICSVYDKFCRHVGSATAVALFAAVVLVLLSFLSTYSLHKRIRD